MKKTGFRTQALIFGVKSTLSRVVTVKADCHAAITCLYRNEVKTSVEYLD